MIKDINRNLTILLLFAGAAALLRFAYLREFSASPLFAFPLGPDVQEYDHWAREILSGRFLWTKANIHAPFYSFFLAGMYSFFSLDFFKLRFFQQMLGFASAIPLFLILAKLHAENPDGNEFRFQKALPLLFILLWTVYPPLIYYQAELISEALLLPFLCLIIYFLYRAEWLWDEDKAFSIKLAAYISIAGILSGLAVITHPFSLLFVLFELIYIAAKFFRSAPEESKKKRFLPPLLFALFLAVPIIPVSVYNSHISGELVFIQKNSGFNLYLGNNPKANGKCYLRPGPEWDKVHYTAEMEAPTCNMSKDRYFIWKTFNFFLKHPFKAASLSAQKAVLVWNWREFTAGADVYSIRYFTDFQRLSKYFSILIIPLALAGFFLAMGNGETRFRYRHFILLVLAFWLAQSIFVTSGRYRLSMYPGIFLFAPFFVLFVISKTKDLKFVIKSLALLLLASAFAFFPSKTNEKREKAEADTIYAEACMNYGKLDKAEQFLCSSLPELGDWSRSYNLYGRLLLERKQYPEAEAMFERAIKLNPALPFGYMNLGNLNSNKGNAPKAEEYFKKALKLNPQSPEVLYNYATFLLKCRKVQEAKKYFKACLKYSPADRKALNSLGIIYILSGRYPEAQDYLERALRLNPGNPQIMVNLAAAYLSDNKRDMAEKWLKKAYRIAPGLPAAQKLQKMLDGN